MARKKNKKQKKSKQQKAEQQKVETMTEKAEEQTPVADTTQQDDATQQEESKKPGKPKRKSSIQWLADNGYQDTVDKIRAFEAQWKEHFKKTGKRIQRSWKLLMLGTSTGAPVKMQLNGDVVEFPVLRDNEAYINEFFPGVDLDVLLKARPGKSEKKGKTKKAKEEAKEQTEKREAAKTKLKEKLAKKRKGRPPKAKKSEEEPKSSEPTPESATEPEAPPKRRPGRPKKVKPAEAQEPKEEEEPKAEPQEVEPQEELQKEEDDEKATPSHKPKMTVLRALSNKEWQTEQALAEVTGQPIRLLKSQLGLLGERNVAASRKTKEGVVEWRKMVKKG